MFHIYCVAVTVFLGALVPPLVSAGEELVKDAPKELRFTEPEQRALIVKVEERCRLVKSQAEILSAKALVTEAESELGETDKLALRALPDRQLSWSDQHRILKIYQWTTAVSSPADAFLSREQQVLVACNTRWLIEFFIEYLRNTDETYRPIREKLEENLVKLAPYAGKLYRGKTLDGSEEAQLLELYFFGLNLSEWQSPDKMALDRSLDNVKKDISRYLDSRKSIGEKTGN